jgi:hypothetical protein
MDSPFGHMNFGGAPGMRYGGIVTKPTRVILAEHGQPEAVVPLDGHPGSRITPGMMQNLQPNKYTPTGPTGVKAPMTPMQPASIDPKLNPKKSGWKRWDQSHQGI